MDLSVTYLLNSGFIVELGRTLLVCVPKSAAETPAESGE